MSGLYHVSDGPAQHNFEGLIDEDQAVTSKGDTKINVPEAARRAILRRILGTGALLSTGFALPDRWTRPVVESVLLPAHAQTSVEPDSADTADSTDSASGCSTTDESSGSLSFNSPGTFEFCVPEGTTQVEVTARGGGGGSPSSGGAGGSGAQATGTLSVNAGEILSIPVGGAGSIGIAARWLWRHAGRR